TRLSTGPVRGSRRIRGDEEAPRRHDQDRAASALLVGWALVARALVERSRASAEVGCVGLDESSELGQFGGQGIRIVEGASHDRQALGVVTGGVFYGHADAAVHLNRFLTDVAGGLVDDDLRGDDVAMTVLLGADGLG